MEAPDFVLTLRDQAPFRTKSALGGGGYCAPELLYRKLLSSHGGGNVYFCSQPMNIKNVKEQLIFKLGLLNFKCSFYSTT